MFAAISGKLQFSNSMVEFWRGCCSRGVPLNLLRFSLTDVVQVYLCRDSIRDSFKMTLAFFGINFLVLWLLPKSKDVYYGTKLARDMKNYKLRVLFHECRRDFIGQSKGTFHRSGTASGPQNGVLDGLQGAIFDLLSN